MEIVAKRGYGGLYYAPAYLSSPCLDEIAFIKFAIDTGATITSVSSVDAVLNVIDCSKLQPLSPTFSATTPNMHTCFISNCKLGFVSDDCDDLSIEELSQVNVFCDSQNVTIQSVLGLNLLVNYQIYFNNDKMRMILYR
ncbi:MAG: hypothetical protein ACRD8W_02700 [Nitrososphaeraceae archaeon]